MKVMGIKQLLRLRDECGAVRSLKRFGNAKCLSSQHSTRPLMSSMARSHRRAGKIPTCCRATVVLGSPLCENAAVKQMALDARLVPCPRAEQCCERGYW